MKATFQQAIALGTALTGSPDAYDTWAQQEQARVLIEYAQRQQEGGTQPSVARQST